MEISISDIIGVIRKYFFLICLMGIIGAVSFFSVSNYVLPKTYISVVKLYVAPNEHTDNISQDLNSLNYAQRIVNTYMEMLNTDAFYEEMINQMNSFDTVGTLRQKIQFSSLNDTEMFQAQVTAGSPAEAKQIADTIAGLAPDAIASLKESAKLQIVDPPRMPTAPSSPRVMLNTVAGAFLLAALTVVIALLKSIYNVKVKSEDEFTEKSDLALLATIPNFYHSNEVKPKKNKKKGKGAPDPTSLAKHFAVYESFKKARMNIVFSIPQKKCKKFVVTSSLINEGKSTTALNLAVSLAEQVDTRVLLVDADLRKMQLTWSFGLKDKPGLTNYLGGGYDLPSTIHKVKGLPFSILSGGFQTPNPAELLGSAAVETLFEELEKQFDFIVIDTPPVNIVIDAVPLAKLTDGAVFVFRENFSNYPEIEKTKKAFSHAKIRIIGAILNDTSEYKNGSRKRRYNYKYDGYSQEYK